MTIIQNFKQNEQKIDAVQPDKASNHSSSYSYLRILFKSYNLH